MRKRKERFVVPDGSKILHELKLLNGRALYTVKLYVDYRITDSTHDNAKRLFKDYKNNRKEVITAIKSAFKFLTELRYEPEEDCIAPKNPPPTAEKVAEAKKYLNQLAKKLLNNT